MNKLTEDLLERYHDGELSPREAEQVEQLLAESPEFQESLKKMSRIGDLLRLMNEEFVADASFEGFGERIEAGIRRADKPSLLERVRVWSEEFLQHRRTVWVPAVAAAGVAAAILIALPFVGSPPGKAPPQKPVIEVYRHPQQPSPGSTIRSVDFGGSQGAKYEVRDEDHGTVGVVWIVEKP